jgi:NTP pyrophosphatase (non-canonical NTP hydrolase)
MAGGTAQGEISAKEIEEMREIIPEELYRRAIDEWGSDLQRWMLVEELSELMIALSKVKRTLYGKENLAEEIADARRSLEILVRKNFFLFYFLK